MRAFGTVAGLPFRFRKNRISPPGSVSRAHWQDYLSERINKPGIRILEIGARNATGANRRSHFSAAEHIGFDFYAGENVDVVGDVDKLSSYLMPGEAEFDLVFLSAVFKDLHMPWVAATEIQKVLKVGGFVFIETQFSYSSHERPWHFFQFSDMGLRALFNESLEFDLVESGMSNPISGYFDHNADSYLKHQPVTEFYCHSEILRQKRCEVDSFVWTSVAIDGVVEGSRYPAPRAAQPASPRI